jgi:hypothetical protein
MKIESPEIILRQNCKISFITFSAVFFYENEILYKVCTSVAYPDPGSGMNFYGTWISDSGSF